MLQLANNMKKDTLLTESLTQFKLLKYKFHFVLLYIHWYASLLHTQRNTGFMVRFSNIQYISVFRELLYTTFYTVARSEDNFIFVIHYRYDDCGLCCTKF